VTYFVFECDVKAYLFIYLLLKSYTEYTTDRKKTNNTNEKDKRK